ncbi:chemotaxis-specific protein-glutamate methyltransferase CheB [Endothiovibrio diazotrophicus]
MATIKALVVDDSALMRRHLTQVLNTAGGFEVRVCRNGVEALQELEAFAPDVISLDINMPDMDGLTALSRIMVIRPTPVVMVSSLTRKGALATLEALALGAVDYVLKPGGTISLSIHEVRAELVTKLRTAAGARLRGRGRAPARPAAPEPRPPPPPRAAGRSAPPPGLVLLGLSTGGPRTIEEVLPALPADFPFPIIVAQHMPASFTATFAARLDNLCALRVSEVTRPVDLLPGNVYLGRGDADVVVARRGNGLSVLSRPADPAMLWHPSVEVLVRSAMEYMDPGVLIGVLMTGMGYDGAEAMTELHRRGGRTIAEAEATAVVFGMPAELIARGGAEKVLPSERVGAQLLDWARG